MQMYTMYWYERCEISAMNTVLNKSENGEKRGVFQFILVPIWKRV